MSSITQVEFNQKILNILHRVVPLLEGPTEELADLSKQIATLLSYPLPGQHDNVRAHWAAFRERQIFAVQFENGDRGYIRTYASLAIFFEVRELGIRQKISAARGAPIEMKKWKKPYAILRLIDKEDVNGALATLEERPEMDVMARAAKDDALRETGVEPYYCMGETEELRIERHDRALRRRLKIERVKGGDYRF